MKFFGFDIRLINDKDKSVEALREQMDEFKSMMQNAPKKTNEEEIEVELPTKAGRTSAPDGINLLNLIYSELAQINPEWNIKFLEALEHLGMHNADVSYAVENIVSLGNTNHMIEFEDAVGEVQAAEMRKHLAAKSRKWYNHAEGLHSLCNDLFAQVALTGAVSAEIIPNDGLTGIKKIVLVTPKNIRFVYNMDEDRYLPHQSVNGQFNLANVAGLRPLNEASYKYIALRRFNENPYGIPPFLSALENIGIERDMVCNMSHIIKKMGALGFLQVLLTKPSKLQAETDIAYQTRCATYLNSVIPEVSKSMAKGIAVGFKDTHEFKLDAGAAANAEGASKLFDINNRSKMAGMKQDGLMFGLNTSTSETLGRVILAKMGKQVVNYQKTISALLREAYLIELNLAGFKINALEVTFDKPMTSDDVKDEEAFAKKIENQTKLRDQGFISQQQAANALGYEKPFLPGPLVPIDPATGKPVKESPDPQGSKGTAPEKGSNMTDSISSYQAQLGIHHPIFDYGTDDICGCISHSMTREVARYNTDPNDGYERYTRNYVNATRAQYRAAVKKASKQITDALVDLGKGATLQQVTDKIFFVLYKHWAMDFKAGQKKIIKKYVEEAYVTFRQDPNPLGKLKAIPVADFGVADTRTIKYFQDSDDLYLGKFITDADTRKALTKFIKDEYVANNMPLGSTEGAIAFREKFGDMFIGEEWKLDRIISTTVNKLRNSAAVAYMNQAEIEEFEIVGVNDRLQCGYCKNLQGKRFSVSKAVDKVNEFVKSSPEVVKYDAPFITSLYKKPEDMVSLSGEALQLAGVGTPPFHCGCRDTIVAVL